MSESQSGLFWQKDEKYSGQLDRELTPVEIQLRDKFVTEYLIDYDAYNAAIRCGFASAFALTFSQEFMGESYVQQEITRRKLLDESQDEEQLGRDKALIASTLRQACQNGPYASRVAAAKALAEIRGLSKPAGTDTETDLIQTFKEFAQKAPV